MMHTIYYGSVYINHKYESFKHKDRDKVRQWLDRITKSAFSRGLRIYAPKIVPETTADMMDVANGDAVILDWHPEWRRSE